MQDIDLTQSEADALSNMEKECINDDSWDYPIPGTSVVIPLCSVDKHENFSLDISRGSIELAKAKHQNRARKVVVLVRLDCGGAAHQNPDGEVIPCPHLHEYREGYGDKWARPAPLNTFANTNDMWQTLWDFMGYCKVTKPPVIIRGLFT